MAARRWNNANGWSSLFEWDGEPTRRIGAPVNALPRVLIQMGEGASAVYFSDGRWVDPVAGIVAKPRLNKTVTFEKRIGTAFWNSSGRSSAAVGSIELINSDRKLDYLAYEDQKDKVVLVRAGWDDLPIGESVVIARGLVSKVEMVGEDLIRIVVADATKEIDKPIQTVTIPSGQLAGQKYPVTVGRVLQVPSIQTGSPDLKFSYSDGAVIDIGIAGLAPAPQVVSEVRDSGVLLTNGTQWNTLNTSPDFGVVLNQATSGRVTALVVGEGPEFSTIFNARIRNVIYTTLFRAGFSAARALPENLSSLQLSNLGFIGKFANEGESCSQVMDEIADSVGGWWLIDSDGVFDIGRLQMPSGDPDLYVTKATLRSEIQYDPDLAPGLSDSLLAGRNVQPLSENEQAGSVRDTAEGALQRREFRIQSYFSVHSSYAAAIASRASSRDRGERQVGMPTLWQSLAAAELSHRASLYSGPRGFYRFQVVMQPDRIAALKLHSVIRLEMSGANGPYTRDGRLIAMRGEAGKDLVELTMWGESPPSS